MKIPFLSFEDINNTVRNEITIAFEKVFESKWYVLGEKVEQFEKEYASFNGVNHCVGLSNGLDALYLALKALGVGEGDEVIVPSNTYIATLLAVSYVGAKPVLVEPNPITCNIDPSLIEEAITSSTKAIMPVHLYGQCCEMDAIMNIARKHKLFVVEDNAQSQGASFNGRLAGSFGDINGTSFYPGKNLGALGDAGGATTDFAHWAERLRVLRNYGSQKKYYNEVIGHNMRLDELQAAFLSVKLKYLANWTAKRQDIAGWYDETLKDISQMKLPVVAKGATHVYHLYVVRTESRDQLQQYLAEKEIGSLIHYPVPPHLQQAYANLGLKKGDLPIAEDLANTCLSLPLWPGMTQSQVAFVGDTIKDFFQKKW
ncbi:MAG: DegT/DnrJ/EryC1/StrS family aminotransferase [Chitinophagaceae bacterium]|nr:MAG: DegT/DnrJ/EryC1/StrS family aminotransferase [Chitinophagaceae bacterium]